MFSGLKGATERIPKCGSFPNVMATRFEDQPWHAGVFRAVSAVPGTSSVIHRSFLPPYYVGPDYPLGAFFAADAIQSNGSGKIDKGAPDRGQSRSRRIHFP
jgi:hypothetical protein